LPVICYDSIKNYLGFTETRVTFVARNIVGSGEARRTETVEKEEYKNGSHDKADLGGGNFDTTLY
jgi:hypothetical protein